jgi:hypothetical protein
VAFVVILPDFYHKGNKDFHKEHKATMQYATKNNFQTDS